MTQTLWAFELKALEIGYQRVAGVDEAGRGPLAGPVVAAAAILPRSFGVEGVTDSKKLSPQTRHTLYDQIYANAVSVGIGIVDPVEIDRINILQASLIAMRMAVVNLSPLPQFVLVDGIHPIGLDLPQAAIAGGDAKSISISAASIVAKVTRDRIMAGYGEDYPEYEFGRHKGYATAAHLAALCTYGSCPIHRKSFKGVREHSRCYHQPDLAFKIPPQHSVRR